MRKFKSILILLLFFPFNVWSFGNAENDDLDIMVEVANGRSIEIKKAAAIVSVVTKEDIEKIGAFSIEDVLRTIPGIHVIKDSYVRSNKYVFRGMGSKFNQEAILLIDGIPIKSISTGNRFQAGFGGLTVNNIEKIEVIRGPGSALYGADAYSGVISIVTKNSTNGVVSSRIGEMDTKEVYYQKGSENNYLKSFFSINYESTDGNNETIEYDGQSFLDEQFNTSASLAPSSGNFNRKNIDALFKVNFKDIEFYYNHQLRKDMGYGFGVNDVIDLTGNFDNERYLTKVSYTPEFDDYNFNFEINYFEMEERSNNFLRFYPEGAFGGAFPDGFVATPERKEQNLNIKSKIVYKSFEDHFIQLGFGYEKSGITDIRDYRNFDENNLPIGEIKDFSGDENVSFLTERTRENFNIFIQDEYLFEKDWMLTSGVRYDYYNDFGEAITPRLALVWNSSRKLTTKFVYSSAFRAPNLLELYAKSNPVSMGNEKLEAERLNSYELSFNYDYSIKTNFNINMFYYLSENEINTVPLNKNVMIFENSGEREGSGYEFEFSHKINNNYELYGNYSFQKNKDFKTGEENIIQPQHLFYLRLSGEYNDWNFNIQGNVVSERKRASTDNREDLKGYHKIDFNISRKNILDINGLTAKLYIKNLTNEDIREPSIDGGMKYDYPMPGRNAHIKLTYDF